MFCHPIADATAIQARQRLIQFLMEQQDVRAEIEKFLENVPAGAKESFQILLHAESNMLDREVAPQKIIPGIRYMLGISDLLFRIGHEHNIVEVKEIATLIRENAEEVLKRIAAKNTFYGIYPHASASAPTDRCRRSHPSRSASLHLS